MTKRNPILAVINAGYGETPVPLDAFVQPGETLTVRREDRGGEACEATVLAVVPVGVPVEYAMADQANPPRPRPLMLREREPHTEALYVIQFPEDRPDNPHIFPHSAMALGYQKAAALQGPAPKPETGSEG